MPLVNVMVNSRAYTIACDTGEEDHLKQLAAYVDGKVRELMESVGQVGDTRLLLMAALLLADECFDAQAQLQSHGDRAAGAANDHHTQPEGMVAEHLEAAAKQLEDIAARFAHA
ncbi:MAG TPA: cell division protein ZapA [Rhizomicrobium sp.]|nr:cell division protein ZapA [Rhizomicrobium sp.]